MRLLGKRACGPQAVLPRRRKNTEEMEEDLVTATAGDDTARLHRDLQDENTILWKMMFAVRPTHDMIRGVPHEPVVPEISPRKHDVGTTKFFVTARQTRTPLILSVDLTRRN